MSLGRPLRSLVGWPIAIAAIVCAPGTARSGPDAGARAIKALIVTPSIAEGQPWIDKLGLTDAITVPGLSAVASTVACNMDDVCLLFTGSGKTNATASVAALVFGGMFDLSATYFVIAGAAGIDPAQGTVGSVAWATNVVDYAIAWEIDARTLPSGWTTGYLGVGAMDPTGKPVFLYGTEIFTLDPALVAKSLALSKTATLGDSVASAAFRAPYTGMPAAQPPSVIGCDTVSSDTAWHGALLGNRARAWTTLMTSGSGTYCTAQAADNAILAALQRGGAAGLLDPKRIAVVHAAATFDRPSMGQTAYDSLESASADVAASSLQNLVLAGAPVLADIVSNWSKWQAGVPQ